MNDSIIKALDITKSMHKQVDRDNKKILELKSLCNKLDKESHYLKLDLCNYQCDKDKLEKDAMVLEKEIKFYKNKVQYVDQLLKIDNEELKKEQKHINYMKIFIIILLGLNMYFEYLKYFMFIFGMILLYF